MKKKQHNTPAGIKIMGILILIGAIGGIADGVAYQLYVQSHGVSRFGLVPMRVFWSYISSFPGNLLTALWLLPWGMVLVLIQFKGRKS